MDIITDEVTTAQAAEMLGSVKTRAIARYCQIGKIPGAKLRFGRWYIPRESIKAMQAR